MKRKIKIALIPAAGHGNRIKELPLTKILPKPMLPLLNKPIIEYIIDWLKKAGVERIYLIVSFKKEVFKEYFGNGQDFGVKISYIECPNPDDIGGIADGIYLARDFIKEPFFVVLGDDFTPNFSSDKLIKTFFVKNALALETVVKENNLESLRRACSVKLAKDGRILDIIEKPLNPKWKVRGCGIYLFDPIVFEFIKKTPREENKKDITKTLEIIAKKTKRAYGFMIKKNININTLLDFRQASFLTLRKERI